MGCATSMSGQDTRFNSVHPQPMNGKSKGAISAKETSLSLSSARKLALPGGSDNNSNRKAPLIALTEFGNPRFNGLKQVMSNKSSKVAYTRFLFTIKFNESIVDKNENAPRIQADIKEVESICSDIIISCNEFLNANRNNTAPTKEDNNTNNNSNGKPNKNQPPKVPSTYAELKTMLGANLSDLSSNIIINIAVSLYPNFLRSEQYKEWKQIENTPIETINNKKGLNDKDINSKVTLNFSNQNEARVAKKALSTVDALEIDRLLQTGSWISSLLLTVENLPVCVSLSTARKDRPGFPLIYVNACFERVTGYSRNEIVGQNCRFLQAGKAEQESIERLCSALRNAKPVRVAITNYRKDGMPFKNLLAMKPIFSESGEYRYVVGVQFDVTQDDATPEKLKLADEVLRMLPNVILNGEDDDTLENDSLLP